MAETKKDAKAAKTKEQALMAFRDFDTDKSGTIDKKELQDLAFALGEVMSEEALDEAFKSLDADGSGTIDFDEFYAWFTAERGDSKASTLLKLKLRQRYIMREAKKMKSAIDAAQKKIKPTKPGHNRFHVRLCAGDVPAEAPLGAFVNLTHNKGSAFKELGAPAGTAGVLFITVTAKEGATDDDIEECVNTMNEGPFAMANAALEEDEDAPINGIVAEGPLVVPDGKEKIVMFKVWMKLDPVGKVIKTLQGKLADSESDDSSDEDNDGGGGGGGGGGDAKRSVLGASTADVIKYAGAAVNFGQPLAKILNGKSDGEISVSAELCVDYDRSSLALAAAAARMLGKAEIMKVLSEEAGLELDQVEDGGMDYTEMVELDSYEFEKANGLFKVANMVDQVRAMFEYKMHLQYDSLEKQAKSMTLMHSDDLPKPIERLIRCLLNPRYLRRQVQKIAGKMHESVFNPDEEHPLKATIEKSLQVFGSIDRVAFQTFDAMVSVDFTGVSLEPFFDIFAKAGEYNEGLEPEVIMFGSDKHVGKTRISNYLRGGKLSSITSERDGVETFDVHLETCEIKVYEVAGGEEYEDAINGYADEDTAGVIFVVDAQRKKADQLEKGRELLKEKLTLDEFSRKQPLLVFANKCDLQEVFTVAELTEALKLTSLDPPRPFLVQPCSAATGAGIAEGMDWLEKEIVKASK